MRRSHAIIWELAEKWVESHKGWEVKPVTDANDDGLSYWPVSLTLKGSGVIEFWTYEDGRIVVLFAELDANGNDNDNFIEVVTTHAPQMAFIEGLQRALAEEVYAFLEG